MTSQPGAPLQGARHPADRHRRPLQGALKKLWVDMFGLPVTGNFVSERENVDEDITRHGQRPVQGRSRPDAAARSGKKPAVHEPPLNHVGLWIDDLPKPWPG
jgi:lactoylglutathione lyase